MYRHYIKSIDYKALIEREANKSRGEIFENSSMKLDRNQSKKNQIKSQNKSKMLVRKMNMR